MLLIIVLIRFAVRGAVTTLLFPDLYAEAKAAEDRHDYAKAIDLYRKACNDKKSVACNDLGVLFHDGTGTPQDYYLAQEFLSKACDAGNARGCGNLGVMYANGEGVGRDSAKARQLFNKGCTLGEQDSCDQLKQLP